MVQKLLNIFVAVNIPFSGGWGNRGWITEVAPQQNMKRNGSLTEKQFYLPVIGTILSLVFFVLGHYLRTHAAYPAGVQGDDPVLLLVYILFREFSYFYSGIFFLISIAGFIWSSTNKEKPSISEERKSLSDLRELSWNEFREYVMGLFQKLGYIQKSGMDEQSEGTDLKVKRDGRLSMVRCKKYYVKKVSLLMLNEFYEAISREPSLDKGYFITTGSFSHEARKFASDKPLVLIDGERLMDFARIAKSIDASHARSCRQNNLGEAGYKCPMCGAHMLLRTVENNSQPAAQFWGCSAYPACKGALRKEREDLVSSGFLI